MSIRWCGTWARSCALGLAVPMSMPRYTCAESTLTTSSAMCGVSASAMALLPLAVGPASTSARSVIAAKGKALRPAYPRRRGAASDQRVGARQVDHALDLAVAQAAPAQGVGGLHQVVERGAEAAFCVLEDVHQFVIVHRLHEARAAARQREGQRA